MRIGLASYDFINGDISFNFAQMEKGMKKAQGEVDLLCFGETFLQGFDALSWNYDQDREMAVCQDSRIMREICRLSDQYGMAVLFGYIEREGEALYSSCAVVERGKIIHNYRRISEGWKESSQTDGHYREGTDTAGFLWRGRQMTIALCGDLWEYPLRFQTDGLLIWPVYVNFSMEEWESEAPEYAHQAVLAASQTLMVNSISEAPRSYGGAFYFRDGQIAAQTAYGEEDILIVDL